MVMLQNVCENSVRILEEDPHVRYLVKKMKETGILMDKPKGAAVAESVCEAPPSFSAIEHLGDIIDTNFA